MSELMIIEATARLNRWCRRDLRARPPAWWIAKEMVREARLLARQSVPPVWLDREGGAE
jgi:hypothetical protein